MRRHSLMTMLMVIATVLGGALAREISASSASQAATQTQEPATGWLGVALSCAGCDGGADTVPVVVRAVTPGGPASRFLHVGDTIVSANRTVTNPRQMRMVLGATKRDSAIELEIRGERGNYTIKVRKQADRLTKVGNDSLPLKYEGEFHDVVVEVLTGTAPVISRDSTGAMIIRIDGHVVRLTSSAVTRS